jgi:hypothetical protein
MYNDWLGVNTPIHPSFDLQPPLYKFRYKNIFIEDKFVFRWRILGKPKCHKKLNRSSGDLMDISLCPWYVEMTYDPDRYPESLTSARCKCKHCYSFDGFKYGREKRLNIPRCKEIKQMIKVLKIQKNHNGIQVCQHNNNKLFLFKESYEEITVGCTCALKGDKRVKQSNFKTGS